MTPDGAGGGVRAQGGLRAFLEIARAGLVAVVLHPLASVVSVLCLVAMIAPLLLAEGLSRGVAEQAEDAVAAGADLWVTGVRFGRPAPLPREAAERIRAVPGVQSVEARIVGSVTLGINDEPVLFVGLSADRLPGGAALVEGRLWRPGASHELVVGSELARRLALKVGSPIPPFYTNDEGEHVCRVVGVFRADLPMWQAHMVATSFETASEVFAEKGAATSLLVTCPDVYRDAARTAIGRLPTLGPDGAPPVRGNVVTRDAVRALVERSVHLREGAFAIHLALAFAVGIPLLLATTGLGLSERRRETGLLKALGWRTDEVVLRSLCESLALAALGWAVAMLVVWAWVRFGHAAGAAVIFLPDADVSPGFEVPFRLVAEPAVVSALVAVVLTSTGTLFSAWRAASAPPAEAVR